MPGPSWICPGSDAIQYFINNLDDRRESRLWMTLKWERSQVLKFQIILEQHPNDDI